MANISDYFPVTPIPQPRPADSSRKRTGKTEKDKDEGAKQQHDKRHKEKGRDGHVDEYA